MSAPLCFVLIPRGRKPDAAGRPIDFDAVYRELIAPAIAESGLEPLRAEADMSGGIIHEPMFERLILCEYAVADVTTADANVFYELGQRHALRPLSTASLYAQGAGQPPFDVAPLRAIPYALGPDGMPADIEPAKRALVARLQEARKAATDSTVYELVEAFPDIQRLKTDVFRERLRYAEDLKRALFEARREGLEEVESVEARLGPIAGAESCAVLDLYLSYRAVKGWAQMIALVDRMSPPLAATVLVQEQLAFALNRAGRGEEAERVLCELIDRRGPSGETNSILGRVYKDRWETTLAAGDTSGARSVLDQAIEAYVKGFESDWRDAYPGINAVTLMELKDPPDPRRNVLIPVVRYAVERRVASGKPDYWDHATRCELAVLARDQHAAAAALAAALAQLREPWEAETTARNLRLIREARERRGDQPAWGLELERALAGARHGPPPANPP
jgi:hypothetical protein